MKIKKQNILQKAGIALSLTLAMGGSGMLTSCTDDWMDDMREYGVTEAGDFGELEIIVPIDTEESDSKTRTGFNKEGIELKSIWVAMFDSYSGSLVSWGETTFDPSQTPGDGHPNKPTSPADYAVILRNLRFYDENNTVYIVGVGNYENVMVKTAYGNDSTLIDALRGVNSMWEYKRIAVDAASAEAAMAGGNAPLMSGFWGTSHGNFTIGNDGKVTSNNSSESLLTLYDTSDMKVKPEYVKHIQEDGLVHLRRLYSHINVNVNVSTAGFKRFENPTVEVVNIPRYTFIQEHTTVTDADAYKKAEDWLEDTHTAADLFEDGYYPTTGLIVPKNSDNSDESDKSDKSNKYIEPYNSGFFMNSGKNASGVPYDDQLKVNSTSGNVATNITFGYWHYESKHWGRKSLSKMNDRENRFGTSGVYSSLCPKEELDFNNYATYFIIRADVESHDGYQGKAEFYVHEGYCCQQNGDASTDEAVIARDFSTFRNTDYTYNVSINGMNSIVTKVNKEDFSGSGAYSGVGGEIWSSETRSTSLPKGESSYTVGLPGGKFYWAIEEDGKIYGVPLDDEDLRIKYAAFPNVTETDFSASKFYSMIRIDGKALGEVSSIPEETKATLTFRPDDALDAKLYIVGVESSSDGLAILYSVYQFDKSGNRLDTPVITMPYATDPKRLVMGLDDHTIRWKKDDDATRYRIELVQNNGMGGYYVEFNMSTDINKDLTDSPYIASGKTITDIRLEEDSEGYLYYKMRYANSVGALMNFLNTNNPASAQVTIKVTAYGADGVEPQSGTYTMTIVNPFWDLNSTEWQAAIGALKTGTATNSGGTQTWTGLLANQTATVDGMSLHTGAKADVEYLKTGNTYVIQPHGSGSSPVTTSNPQRYFGFHACTRGKTRAWGSSTSSSKNTDASKARHMVTAFTGGSPVTSATDASASATGSPAQLADMTNITPTPSTFKGTDENIFMYSDADIRIYKLQFVPEDVNLGTK